MAFLLLMILSFAGCAKYYSDECMWFEKVDIEKNRFDALPVEEKMAIDYNNEMFKERCP